jgi:hypothetical protein
VEPSPEIPSKRYFAPVRLGPKPIANEPARPVPEIPEPVALPKGASPIQTVIPLEPEPPMPLPQDDEERVERTMELSAPSAIPPQQQQQQQYLTAPPPEPAPGEVNVTSPVNVVFMPPSAQASATAYRPSPSRFDPLLVAGACVLAGTLGLSSVLFFGVAGQKLWSALGLGTGLPVGIVLLTLGFIGGRRAAGE